MNWLLKSSKLIEHIPQYLPLAVVPVRLSHINTVAPEIQQPHIAHTILTSALSSPLEARSQTKEHHRTVSGRSPRCRVTRDKITPFWHCYNRQMTSDPQLAVDIPTLCNYDIRMNFPIFVCQFLDCSGDGRH